MAFHVEIIHPITREVIVMSKYTHFSPRASLAALGSAFRHLWRTVEEHVHICQKEVRYSPISKLLMATLNILAGGQGLVEINTRLRADHGLLRAFGCPDCAEQSGVSRTLDACTEAEVKAMREAQEELLHRYGQCVRHHARSGTPLLLDLDLTGLLAGRQGEGVSKGYFSGQPGARGRQLARVLASDYDELVLEKLYPGHRQLPHVLEELVQGTEAVLGLTDETRRQTIWRVDAGAGSDAQINWLLERGYLLLTKVTSTTRAKRLARSVGTWYRDPKEPRRELGWPEAPHAYARATQQLVIRHRRGEQYRYRVLVWNLDEATLAHLAHQPLRHTYDSWQRLCLAAYAYDRRGGGIETSHRNSKQGLGLMKRNKRRFCAQEMLVLLAGLTYNFLTWVRPLLIRVDAHYAHYGPRRLIRDLLQIPGQLDFGSCYQLQRISLARDHPFVEDLLRAFGYLSFADAPPPILRKI